MKKKSKILGVAGLAMAIGLCACGQKEVTTTASVSESGNNTTTASVAVSESGNNTSTASVSVEENASSVELSSSSNAESGSSSSELKSTVPSSAGAASAEGSGSEISAESSSSDVSDVSDESAAIDSQGHKKVAVKATGDVLIDADGFYAVITDKKTDEFGYSWEIHCENNTGSTVYFGMENVSVNGVMAIPLFQAEVEPGSSVDETAKWNMDFKGIGIETPVIIEGRTIILDKESYSMINQAQFAVCPEGEEKAYYVTRADEETDKNIISNDYVNCLCTSFSQGEFDEVVMSIYLNNKSDKDIILSMDGCFVNDAEADPFWAAFLPAGKSVYTNIYWPLSDLQAAGIESFESINKIVAEFSVYDQGTYEVYSNELVTLEV